MGNDSNLKTSERNVTTADNIIRRGLPQLDTESRVLPKTYFPSAKPKTQKFSNLTYRVVSLIGIIIIGFIVYTLIVSY